MKAESMQLFVIPITQNYQGVSFAPNPGDASHVCHSLRFQAQGNVYLCSLAYTLG